MLLRRGFLNLLGAIVSGIFMPVQSAADALGSITCQSIRGGLQVSGDIQGHALLPSNLLPGRTYSVVQDGDGFRLV